MMCCKERIKDMFTRRIIPSLQMSFAFIRFLFLFSQVPFSKDPKCCKSWLDEDVKEATKALGKPNATCLEFIYGTM